MKTVTCIAALPLLVLACGGQGGADAGEHDEARLTEPVSVTGFSTPESVLHDPTADVYLVSNINGGPLDADDNGFISRVSPAGELLELKWIDGAADGVTLNAPKGMTLSGDRLYVSDMNVVRMFDRTTGEPRGEITVPGATFLNDLATGPDGTVYLTDTGLNAAFEDTGTAAAFALRDGEFVEIISGTDLMRPNGIVVDDRGVWVVTYGGTELFRVSDGAKADVATLPAGGLDGVVAVGETMFVSSWADSSILAGGGGAAYRAVVTDVPSPADIGYDYKRHYLLIPLFMDNEIRIVPIN